ncbi:unnamed protein product [Linum trigynum]|uniref:Uncharacterized protein n=1 Tax=Linum trigynum TaxID=586398 RepID=A0AAV2GHC0_9ROSI
MAHHLLLHLFLVALSLLSLHATTLQPNNPASSPCKGKLSIGKNMDDDGGSGQEGQRRKLLQKMAPAPPPPPPPVVIVKVPGAGAPGGNPSGKKDKKGKGKKGKKGKKQ